MGYLQTTQMYIAMIEDGQLVNKEDVADMYNTTPDKVDELLCEPDFKNPIRFAGTDYWFTDHVKLLLKVKDVEM